MLRPTRSRHLTPSPHPGTVAGAVTLVRSVRSRLAALPASSLRMRWAVVVVPPLIVAILALMTDTVLDEMLPVPWSAVTVSLAVLAIGLIVAAMTFGRIDVLSVTLRARHEELEARSASARALNRVSLAIASLFWGAADASMDQPIDLPAFAAVSAPLRIAPVQYSP